MSSADAAGDGETPTTVALVGATATGKSALAMELARREPAEIVNADALQAYRGLDLGTAKPSAADRRAVRHHLIDLLDPREAFSAGRFAELAGEAIAVIAGSARRPLVVGGSGLYLDALFEGLAPIPPVDGAIRAALESQLEEQGPGSLLEELSRVDPRAAANIDADNPRRVLRALEVHRATGRTLSSWHEESGVPRAASPLWVGLRLERRLLHRRIEERTDRMLAAGWIEEVATLLEAGVRPDAPAFQAIGYRQIASFLNGATQRDALRREILVATRRYARRQETWFRRRREIHWIDASRPLSSQADIVGRLVARGRLPGDRSPHIS